MMTPRAVHQVLKPLREIGAALQSLDAAAIEMIRWEAGLTDLQARHAALTAEATEAEQRRDEARVSAQQIQVEAVETAKAMTAQAQDEVTRLRSTARKELEKLQHETLRWTERAKTAQAEHDALLASLKTAEAETRTRVAALLEQARTLARQAQALDR